MDFKLKFKNFILNKVIGMPNVKIYNAQQTENLKLSEHISGKEARCKCCHKLVIDMDFVNLLEILRNRLGVPVHFSRSFYRCKTNNIKAGGGTSSAHMEGCADDFDCFKKLPAMKVLDIVNDIFKCRYGIYQSRDSELAYFHVDSSKKNKLMWISRLVNGKNQYTYYTDFNSLKNALLNDKKIKWTEKWC